MLWVTLLATVAVALAEVEIITSPTPGNEYVHISGAPQDTTNSTDPSKILVKDEGLSGVQHKHYQNKKVDHHPLKKENLGVKATVKDEGLSGVVKKQSGIGVPALKHMDDPKYDVVSRHKSSKWDGGIDFDDDLPLSDKKLKPAGTSQSSRINVKKGPNGQEYEYEYVYYYYDDEEEGSTAAPARSGAAAPTPARGQYSDVDRPTTSRRPSSEASEEPRVRGELVKQKNVESGPEPPRSRGDSIDHRGGHRVVEVTEIDDEELYRRRAESRNDDRSKNRYTTIERGSGPSGGRGRGDAVAVTTAEPSTNEVLPSRGAQRGRQVETAVIEDDRLPANTRFPSRGRGSSVATTIPPQPSAPAQTQTSRSRTSQGNGATIRRPSLVDSSSFRTHASDPAPDADFDRNYYRSSPLDNTRESDLEEYVQPELVRPTTFIPAQTTLPPSPAPLPDQREQSMPDKAALDLYAILQQQQEENSVSGLGTDTGSYSPTEIITTAEPTTVTTTTTTTPAPTTTTTTTTTPAPPPVGRGRFRGAPPGSRTRLRPGGASTTTTTTEAPQEEETPRRKFSPSSSGRSPGQVSAYGRRGSGARASTTTSAPAQEQEASTARTRASFGGNSNRYRARGRTTAAPASHDDEATPEASSGSTTTSRPTRPRLNVSAATRPLRPGPRINLRGRAGISTTAATPAAAPEEEEAAPAPSSTSPPPPQQIQDEEGSSPAPSDALSRLRNRPRLKVTPRQPGGSNPTAAAPRPPPVGFKRPGRPLSQQQTSAAPEEPAQAPTEPAPAHTEPAPAEAAPTEPPSPVPPHLARRRPAIRRLQIPHHQNQ